MARERGGGADARAVAARSSARTRGVGAGAGEVGADADDADGHGVADDAVGKRDVAREDGVATSSATGDFLERNAFGTVDAYDLRNAMVVARTLGGASARRTLDTEHVEREESPSPVEEGAPMKKYFVGSCLDPDIDFSQYPIELPEELFFQPSPAKRTRHDDVELNPAESLCRGCRRWLLAAKHFEANKKTCRQCLTRQRLKKHASQRLGGRVE